MSGEHSGAEPTSASPRLDPAERATVALVLAGVGWAAWLTSRTFFYYDDFPNLTIARDLGFTWDALSRDLFGHFSPGMLATVWVVARPGHGTYLWAALTTVGWFATMLVLVARTATALGARGWAVPAAVALTAANVAWDPSLLWWSAQLNTIPVAAGGLALLLGHLRHLAGHRRGLLLAVAGFSWALASSEGAVVFVIPVVVVTAAWSLRGSAAVRLGGLLRLWRVWLLELAPVAALVGLRSLHSYADQSPAPSWIDLVTFPWWFATKGFAPAQFGWTIGRFELLGSAGSTTVVASVGLVVLATWFAWRTGAAGVVAIATVAACVVVRGWMVGWGRLGLLGQVAASEPRYVVDLVWLAPVLGAGAWARRPPSHRDGRPILLVDVWVPRVVAPLALLLVLGAAGQAAALHNGQSLGSRAYLDRFRSSLARAEREAGAGGRRVSVLDTTVPADVLGPQFGAFVFVSRTIDFGVEGVVYNDPTRALYAPDQDGTLRPVRLDPAATVLPAAAFTARGAAPLRNLSPGCWRADAGATILWLPLSAPLPPGQWVLDLAVTSVPGPAPTLLAAGSEPLRAITTTDQGRRAGRWLLSAQTFAATQIGFALAPHQRVCFRSGTIDAPAWADR